jgi:indolepyruvate ferredoxin oxidoreductase beta subunit
MRALRGDLPAKSNPPGGAKMNFDVLIAGVGGQGTVLASKILGKAAADKGLCVRTGETIGMAQRGGSVVSHVRIDSEDKSPLIPVGRADVLIAFEPSEAARHLCRLKKGGKCLVNTRPMPPVTSSILEETYDENKIIEYISMNSEACFVDGSGTAEDAGSIKTLNVVMLAAASRMGMLPFDMGEIRRAMETLLPQKVLKMNEKAFDAGINLACEV